MSIYGDLFQVIFDLIDNKNITVESKWMPSHLNQPNCKKSKPRWVEPWHVTGNAEADRLAGEAARVHQLPATVTDPIVKTINTLKAVQRRIVAVIKSLPHRHIEKSPKQVKVTAAGSWWTLAASPANLSASALPVTCHGSTQRGLDFLQFGWLRWEGIHLLSTVMFLLSMRSKMTWNRSP
jgi:hypothetical protein